MGKPVWVCFDSWVLAKRHRNDNREAAIPFNGLRDGLEKTKLDRKKVYIEKRQNIEFKNQEEQDAAYERYSYDMFVLF